MISKQRMATELAALYAVYNRDRPANAAFGLLIDEWCDVLDRLTEAELLAAMKLVKRSCRYLPVPADVWAAAESLRRGMTGRTVSELPEQTRTKDEQILLNMAWINRIRAKLRSPYAGRESKHASR